MAKEGFVFNTPWNEVVGRADNLTMFKKLLKTVPEESLRFHSERGDFTAWLNYLGKKEYAKKFARIKDGNRNKLIAVFSSKTAKKKTTTSATIKRTKKNKTAKKSNKKTGRKSKK